MVFFVKLSLLLPEYQNTDSCKLSHWPHESQKYKYFWLIFSWLVFRGFVLKGCFCLFICFGLQDIMQCCNTFAGRIKSAEKLLLCRALCFFQLASGSTNAFLFFNCISAGNFFPVNRLNLSGAAPNYGIGLKSY